MVIRQCSCGCCMLVIEKFSEDSSYSISIQDSRYCGNDSLINRIKNAIKILLGKPVYYNDLLIDNEEEYDKLLEDMDELRGK